MRVVGCCRDKNGQIRELDSETEKKIARNLVECMAKALRLEIEWA